MWHHITKTLYGMHDFKYLTTAAAWQQLNYHIVVGLGRVFFTSIIIMTYYTAKKNAKIWKWLPLIYIILVFTVVDLRWVKQGKGLGEPTY